MENEVGVPVTPSFPKLIFVLDENNVPKDSEYRYLKDLAVKCVAKRMMPDFISPALSFLLGSLLISPLSQHYHLDVS